MRNNEKAKDRIVDLWEHHKFFCIELRKRPPLQHWQGDGKRKKRIVKNA